jgi:hypothetical protein
MKWFRKNNTKIMAVVVVVLMLGFIAGPTLRYFARMRMGRGNTVAYFADNKKITGPDIMSAHEELEILRLLGTDNLLRSQDLRSTLLGELLFAEQRTSPALLNQIKRAITTNGYIISDKQISDIYGRLLPSDYYWLLLEKETSLAGIRVDKANTGSVLGQIIPQLFKGAIYSQVIQSLIDRHGIPEEQVLETFGKLLAVLQYSHMICSGEDVTSSQIMHAASKENETINVELVEFDPSVFSEAVPEPNEATLAEHFDKYKKFFAGTLNEENPYGFGYKLPDRVQLEYIAIKHDDVSQIVTPPTPQEKEQYYQQNTKQLTKKVPSDPNDPNSPRIEQSQSYAEVANYISDTLLNDKINSQADKIMQEAKALTEADLEDTTGEKQASDYPTAAEQLSKKYKIKIYEGQTGLLSVMDIQADNNLRMLRLKGYGNNPVELAQIVFAIKELKAGSSTAEQGTRDAKSVEMLELLGVSKPKINENIGPLKDIFGQVTALVRVIKAEPACEPQSINQTFSTDGLILDPNQTSSQAEDEGQPKSKNTYSIREKVVEDCKRLAAMDMTKSKAEEFVKLTEKDGWDSAINKFNALYGEQAKKDPNDPNVFRVLGLTDMQRISNATLATLTVQSAGNPLSQFLINDAIKQTQFIDNLYSLAPQDINAIGAGLIMEFKPDMSFYIIKNISVMHLNQAEYEQIKVQRLYKEDHIQTQSAAAVHFNPENISKRMNFRWAKKDKETTDANTPESTEDRI